AELERGAVADVEVLLAPHAIDVLAHDEVWVPDPNLARQTADLQILVAAREVGRCARREPRGAEVVVLLVQGADGAHDRMVAFPTAPTPQLGLVVPHVERRDLRAALEQARLVGRAVPEQARAPPGLLR